MAKPKPILDRLFSRVDCSDPEKCWIWPGTVNNKGYGMIGNEGGRNSSTSLTHRVSWAAKHGPIPPGLFVLHRCDTPRCINPDHLFLGTNRDNVADMVAKGRNSLPPHVPGTKHGQSKLTQEQVDEIRRAGRSITLREQGLRYGVHLSVISRVLRNQTYVEVQ